MVICHITRIVNATNRTFVVQPNDPFYRPKIKDQEGRGIEVEVAPGFDETCEQVVIPWSGSAWGGLYIREVVKLPEPGENGEDMFGPDDAGAIRAVTGPNSEASEDTVKIAGVMHPDVEPERLEWLELYTYDWEPLLQERWIPLGQSHYLFQFGKEIELQLSFRGREDALLQDVVQFDYAIEHLPLNTVLLNVYDLSANLSFANDMLNNPLMKSMGAFHAAVEVYGDEWGFYKTPMPLNTGICKNRKPKEHPVHVYRQSINLGLTHLKDWELRWLIHAKLAPKWKGGEYDVLTQNCIHFCDELAMHLGVAQVPRWITGLHETGAALSRHLPWLIEYVDPSEAVKDNLPDAQKRPTSDNGPKKEEENSSKDASSASTDADTERSSARTSDSTGSSTDAQSGPRMSSDTSSPLTGDAAGG